MIEQRELTWYLSEGITVFERSTCGSILDKLEIESCVSRSCRTCGGAGIVDEPFVCQDPKDRERTITVQLGAWCPRCHGIGVEPVRLSEEEKKLVDSGEMVTSSDRGGARSAVPDEVLVRYAHVSRLLASLPTLTREDLVAAYGDEGDELSKGMKGRVWALLPMTEAGAELLRRERDRAPCDDQVEPERPVQCLVWLSGLAKGRRAKDTTKLLAAALKEAGARLREAEATWEFRVGGLTAKELAK
jgi:hypothetical protein